MCDSQLPPHPDPILRTAPSSEHNTSYSFPWFLSMPPMHPTDHPHNLFSPSYLCVSAPTYLCDTPCLTTGHACQNTKQAACKPSQISFPRTNSQVTPSTLTDQLYLASLPPRLQHQEAFPVNTTAKQGSKAGNTQLRYSLKIQRRYRKQGTKHSLNEDKPRNQNLEL